MAVLTLKATEFVSAADSAAPTPMPRGDMRDHVAMYRTKMAMGVSEAASSRPRDREITYLCVATAERGCLDVRGQLSYNYSTLHCRFL